MQARLPLTTATLLLALFDSSAQVRSPSADGPPSTAICNFRPADSLGALIATQRARNNATHSEDEAAAASSGNISLRQRTRRIIILGSSNAAGAIAGSYSNSWVGRLEIVMSARGWQVINRSISGNGTSEAIARFANDVAPYRPDVVVHATALLNDGNDFAKYTAGITRLIQLTRQIGAVPVVVGQYASSTFTDRTWAVAQAVEAWKASNGIATWEWLGVTADPSNGHWLTGLDAGDGIHPNDAGHAAEFNAIPLNMFDWITASPRSSTVPRNDVWKWGSDATHVPLVVPLDSPANSWTITALIKPSGLSPVDAISIHGASGIIGRVTNEFGTWQYCSDDGNCLVSSISGVDVTWHYFALSYNATTNAVSLFLDGALAESHPATRSHRIVRVAFLSGASDTGKNNCKNCSLWRPAIHRSTLAPRQLSDYAVLPSAGLEWLANMGPIVDRVGSGCGTNTMGRAYSPGWLKQP